MLDILREFHKVTGKNEQSVKVRDTVLIHEDWRMAVMEQLMKVKDG